jgi:hypothetical protein
MLQVSYYKQIDRGLKPTVHNNNFVKIGVNTSTGNITLVKTKLLDVQETSEVILDSEILTYINSLPEKNNYVASYAWNEKTGELRPVVYTIDPETLNIEVLKYF